MENKEISMYYFEDGYGATYTVMSIGEKEAREKINDYIKADSEKRKNEYSKKEIKEYTNEAINAFKNFNCEVYKINEVLEGEIC